MGLFTRYSIAMNSDFLRWWIVPAGLIFLVCISNCKNQKDIKGSAVLEGISLDFHWTEEDRNFILDELSRTTHEVDDEIRDLSIQQWNFHETPERWSIGQIIEHLEVQNELHYRELLAISKTPEQDKYIPLTKGMDSIFSAYATDTLKGNARWFLQPIGRFCSKEESRSAFMRARKEMRSFVENTPQDFRRHFTFRNAVSGKSFNELISGEVRDLHQLLLIGIAHTDRHLKQIRNIKNHVAYPLD